MNSLPFRLAALGLWLGLLAVALLAPPPAPDALQTLLHLATGELSKVNLCLFALFNLMGVWPFVYAVLLRFDSGWRWPFLIGGLALGGYLLLPWLVLRRWGRPRRELSGLVGRFLSSRWLHRALGAAAVGLGVLFFAGDLTEFLHLWRTQQFPFVMGFDFLALLCGAGLLWLERRLQP